MAPKPLPVANDMVQALPGKGRLTLNETGPALNLEGLEPLTNPEDPDWFASGLRFQVKQVGVEIEYDTLMGDLGTAFIMQASDQVPRINGALDAGWWPLDDTCVQTYLDFVGQVHGVRLEFAKPVNADDYLKRFAPRIEAEMRAKRPCLGLFPWWNVIAGLNRETGELARIGPGTRKMPEVWERSRDKPCAFLFVLDVTQPTINRKDADRQALSHALALMRDEIPMPWGFRTGAKGFALWVIVLRDMEHRGQGRWHANVVRRLRHNRVAAVAYLNAMAARWPEPVAAHLKAAGARFQSVIDACAEADTSDAALVKPGQGRENLAALAERMAALEVLAVEELEKALTTAQKD